MRSFISVGGFEYEDEADDFIGLFCPICEQETGYDPCPDPDCKEKSEGSN
jgi:hypothetical protein